MVAPNAAPKQMPMLTQKPTLPVLEPIAAPMIIPKLVPTAIALLLDVLEFLLIHFDLKRILTIMYHKYSR